jgi:hypothetical protein
MSNPNERERDRRRFLEFCANVQKDDPSIMTETGEPFKIRRLSEKEDMELADALLENTNVTYLELVRKRYAKIAAEAMAKYVRTSKHLEHIHWNGQWGTRDDSALLCCFLLEFEESTSLKELGIDFCLDDVPSYLALESMLMHTQSLQSLSLIPHSLLGDIAVAATRSGLKKNNTLRELTLDFSRGSTNASSILTSLHDHPLLQKLCLRGCRHGVDLTGLETLLLTDNSKITELEIGGRGPPMMGLAHVLQTLGRCSPLTKLVLRDFRLGCDDARLLQIALCNTRSL